MATFKKPALKLKSLSGGETKSSPAKSEKGLDSQLSQLFITTPDEINRKYTAEKERKELRKKGVNKQTFRINDGQEKLIWFPQKDPQLGANIHYLFLNGRIYHILCTAALGECALCDAGDRAGFMAIYDIVDCTGYKINSGPNAGKLVKDFHCYYIASDARNTAVSKMFRLIPEDKVQSCLINVERRGSGASTTHIFAIEDNNFEPPDKYIEESLSFDKVMEEWAPAEAEVMEELAEQYILANRNGGVS